MKKGPAAKNLYRCPGGRGKRLSVYALCQKFSRQDDLLSISGRLKMQWSVKDTFAIPIGYRRAEWKKWSGDRGYIEICADCGRKKKPDDQAASCRCGGCQFRRVHLHSMEETRK